MIFYPSLTTLLPAIDGVRGPLSICATPIRLFPEAPAESIPFPEHPMKYLCLIYDSEQVLAKMSKETSDAFMQEYHAFTEDTKAKGHYIAGEALQPVSTATTLRVRNGKLGTTDGPFAETKEQLGGFYMIDAKDLNEAIQVASRIPSAKTGSIEVRPIMTFS
jgi:hypothetical protein